MSEAFTTYDGYVIDHRAESEGERLQAENADLRARLERALYALRYASVAITHAERIEAAGLRSSVLYKEGVAISVSGADTLTIDERAEYDSGGAGETME